MHSSPSIHRSPQFYLHPAHGLYKPLLQTPSYHMITSRTRITVGDSLYRSIKPAYVRSIRRPFYFLYVYRSTEDQFSIDPYYHTKRENIYTPNTRFRKNSYGCGAAFRHPSGQSPEPRTIYHHYHLSGMVAGLLFRNRDMLFSLPRLQDTNFRAVFHNTPLIRSTPTNSFFSSMVQYFSRLI